MWDLCYTSPATKYMLSWSSGQDVALSRRNQGFDSPREYQIQNRVRRTLFLYFRMFLGESNPNGRERPVDGHGPSTAEPRAGRQTCRQARMRNSPREYQQGYVVLT